MCRHDCIKLLKEFIQFAVIITRFSNIYGPGQLNFTALIPEAIRACILNKRLIMRSNGKAIRDFVYIDDIVELYKLLSMNLYLKPKKFSGQVFNVGTNKKHQVKDILNKIYSFANKKKELRSLNKQMLKRKTSGEISIQFMDFKKVNKYLNWKPKHQFEEKVLVLFDWYKKYFKKIRWP